MSLLSNTWLNSFEWKKITVEPFTNGHLHDDHLSTTAIFFGGQCIRNSLLFQPLYKRGRGGEVQL